MKKKKVVLVMGAGDATGGAIARRFSREGYVACVCRRNYEKLQPLVTRIEQEGGEVRAFGTDGRKEEQVVELFATIEQEIGPVEVCVFNVGGNVRFPVMETTSRVYYKVWEMGCFAVFSRAGGGPLHVPEGHDFVSRARAQVPGAGGFSVFSGAKFALRPLGQSMAGIFPPGNSFFHFVFDGRLIPNGLKKCFHNVMRRKHMMEFSIPMTLQRSIGKFIASHARRGLTKWICGPGWKNSESGVKSCRSQ
ncbi:MAG: short-chain dehydrogenase [Gammaproteobacteria bacterium]|nr:MAG: short-chain dehydrogenase [Gammaproteobacteria bacterium]